MVLVTEPLFVLQKTHSINTKKEGSSIDPLQYCKGSMIQVIEQFIVNYLYISKLRTGVELTYFCELQLFGLSLWKKKEKWSQAVNVTTIIILEKSRSTERID